MIPHVYQRRPNYEWNTLIKEELQGDEVLQKKIKDIFIEKRCMEFNCLNRTNMINWEGFGYQRKFKNKNTKPLYQI